MRNKKPVFLTAQWQNLAMLNYEVDPQILLPYLPPFTQLDSFNNKTLVSVVGFMFNNTKVFRLKWPLHVNFEEVNLRFKNEDLHVSYEWKHKQKWNKIHVVADASLTPITRGSEEEFIFEHYWGYNKYNNRTTVEYEVEHVTWQIHKVKNWSIDNDVAGLYGQQFVPFLKAEPSSVFLAKGSDVVIRKPTFIKKATG